MLRVISISLLAALVGAAAGQRTVQDQIRNLDAQIGHYQQAEQKIGRLLEGLNNLSLVITRGTTPQPLRVQDIRDHYAYNAFMQESKQAKPDLAAALKRGEQMADKFIYSQKVTTDQYKQKLLADLSKIRTSRQKAQAMRERLRLDALGEKLAAGNFTGTWYSSVGQYGYRHDLTMSQSGNHVTGTWTHASGTGTIDGFVTDRTLKFKWTATGANGGSDQGTGTWEINRENNSFSGTYSSDAKDGVKNNGWRGHKLKS